MEGEWAGPMHSDCVEPNPCMETGLQGCDWCHCKRAPHAWPATLDRAIGRRLCPASENTVWGLFRAHQGPVTAGDRDPALTAPLPSAAGRPAGSVPPTSGPTAPGSTPALGSQSQALWRLCPTGLASALPPSCSCMQRTRLRTCPSEATVCRLRPESPSSPPFPPWPDSLFPPDAQHVGDVVFLGRATPGG